MKKWTAEVKQRCRVRRETYMAGYTLRAEAQESCGSCWAFSMTAEAETTALRLKNSWGTGWGEAGFMWIKYGSQLVGYSACYSY